MRERARQGRDDAAAHGGQVPEAGPADGAPAARERLRPAEPARVHQVAALEQHHPRGPGAHLRYCPRTCITSNSALNTRNTDRKLVLYVLISDHRRRGLRRVAAPPGDFRAVAQEPLSARAAARALRQLLRQREQLCRRARRRRRRRQSRRPRRGRLAARAGAPPPASAHSPDLHFAQGAMSTPVV